MINWFLWLMATFLLLVMMCWRWLLLVHLSRRKEWEESPAKFHSSCSHCRPKWGSINQVALYFPTIDAMKRKWRKFSTHKPSALFWARKVFINLFLPWLLSTTTLYQNITSHPSFGSDCPTNKQNNVVHTQTFTDQTWSIRNHDIPHHLQHPPPPSPSRRQTSYPMHSPTQNPFHSPPYTVPP